MYVGRGWVRTNYGNTLLHFIIIIIPKFIWEYYLLHPEGKQVSQQVSKRVPLAGSNCVELEIYSVSEGLRHFQNSVFLTAYSEKFQICLHA